MLQWRFQTYVAPSGRTEVQGIVDRYDDYSREAFCRAVSYLAATSRQRWDQPHALKIKGADDLYEIRYKADRAATRALGFFGPASGQFTITLIATHKQNVYKPHDAFKIAQERAKSIRELHSGTAPLQVDGEDFPADDD
jgi:hypothetical protein